MFSLSSANTISQVKQIVITHAHIDHVGGAMKLRAATGAPILLNQNDYDLLKMLDEQATWIGVAAPGKVGDRPQRHHWRNGLPLAPTPPRSYIHQDIPKVASASISRPRTDFDRRRYTLRRIHRAHRPSRRIDAEDHPVIA